MTTATKRTHKHFQLGSAKIKRVQEALHGSSQTTPSEMTIQFWFIAAKIKRPAPALISLHPAVRERRF